ncbi:MULTISPECIES: spermidine synthase [Alphaproteobacteria]|uniref:Spermidine synthase n=2 Tax=Alphaproteobacteria TaxID=28211 RepID=A0A512HJR0_9HYPH|nr:MULTISPECIES: MnmC family methyltransferase [Alphaproteobacteria]GEO85671.1 spermidine synthase [Ciceribacter naphthalenivorans]GLR21974.1 spermidine synthase [Ciceribacter naphthalenivorans]GLT04830.1 spermidine synthase [Sphingomonas psychrolutea]
MLPWIQLDCAQIPGGGGELRLKQRGTEFSIMLGTNELMNSRLSGSEEALATLSWEKISPRKRPHILIGGLGMGFTLRAALAVLPQDALVTVAELVPEVVTWARGPMAEVFQGSLDDPRVKVHVGDVGALISASRNSYDAILLDVDNGPEGLTRAANDDLYDYTGLRAAKAALRPKGVLAVWSSGPDQGFTRRLRDVGLAVQEEHIRAGRNRGARHVIWLASTDASTVGAKR